MRQTFLACLFICFIFFTASVAQTVNQADLLKQLLNLPAPPPPDEYLSRVLNVKTVRREREPEFYDLNRVPPDDAPIEDLLEYWGKQSQNQNSRLRRYNINPSEKTLERILEFCEENPDSIGELLNIVPTKPKYAEAVKRIYDKLAETEKVDYKNVDYKAEYLKQWLVFHSNYFVDELLKKAEKVQDTDKYVTNQTELLALARVDWEKAQPILERLVNDNNQPVSATLAKWAYYAHALETDDDGDISKYRRQLQDAVENRKLSAGNRDLAMDALMIEKEWDERADWYISLLSDETLYELDNYTGLTTILSFTPPEKMIPVMVKLVENKNPAIRKAAVRNLVNYLREEKIDAVRALLPWLSNPNWVTGIKDGRSALIAAVGKVDLPETVPGLIAILTNEEEFRATAAQSLAGYKDSRAVPALKVALANEKNPYYRKVFINALLECGGLSDDEQMSALEFYAAALSLPEGEEKVLRLLNENSETENPVPVALNIGNFVAEKTEPGEGLVVRAIERLKILRKSKPAVAAVLAAIMKKWQGRVIYIERLRQIRSGEADLETVLAAIAKRKEIREKVPNDVFALRGANGSGRGIGACLSEDNADFLNILGQKDAEALAAMFGCARLLRVKLPVAQVGAFLKNANKTLALAAERYLESEDGVEARTLVLAEHPGEAVILGARQAFVPDAKNLYYSTPLFEIFQSVMGRGFSGENFPNLDKNEETLRTEIKTDPDLLAVYAMLPNQTTGQQVIRVFKDKITFTNYEDAARYREKTLTAKEYEDFYRLLINEKIDSAIPSFGYCEGCASIEFVMFGRGGGRRVFFGIDMIERSPVKKILERFTAFNEGELKLHYLLADKIKGLEVLLADDKFTARAVWKNGSDFRVLVEDKAKEEEIRKNLDEQFQTENSVEIDEEDYEKISEREQSQEKRREEVKYAHYFWRGFENGKLGGISSQPPEMPFLIDETQSTEASGINPDPRSWQVRAGNYEIRTGYSEESGIYKVSRGQEPVKFKEGKYYYPIVTADGKWVIISKFSENWGEPGNLVRINLQTGKEIPVSLPPADIIKPIAFIASQNKVLIYRARAPKYNYRRENEDVDETPVQPVKNDKNPSPLVPEYYLLDAATGATEPVKGEFRPLEQQSYRPLQMTAAPNEFWAAVYDKKLRETSIGRYDTKTFAFSPVTKLPEIELDSMNIWVDEKEAKIYFIYEGHLLAAPLQNQPK